MPVLLTLHATNGTMRYIMLSMLHASQRSVPHSTCCDGSVCGVPVWKPMYQFAYLPVKIESQQVFTSCTRQVALHYIILRYITLHHIASCSIAFHCVTLHHIASHCITSHYITSHYITLHYITLTYITSNCIQLHYIRLHCITLH